jgi:autotransporter-associated beta strand protein
MGFDLTVGNKGGGAAVSVSSGAALWLANTGSVANNITLSGTGQAGTGALYNEGTGTATLSGTLTLSGNTTIGGTGGNIIVSNPIAETAASAITKTGAGTLTLAGANNYSGGTSIAAGTVSVNADAALGAVPLSPATNLTFTGSSTFLGAASAVTLDVNRGVQINTGATATFNAGGAANVLTINGAVSNQTSTGNLVLATSSGISAASGTVVLAGNNNFATGSTISLGGTANRGGGILRLANSSALGSNAVTIDAAVGNSNWVGAVELSGGITIGSNVTLNISGHNQGGVGADNLRNFSGSNTFNGAINITATGGFYQINSADALGTLSLGGNISNTLNSSRTLNFIGDGNTEASGVLAETGPSGSLLVVVKSGAGTLKLNNANTYTGATSVNAGELVIGTGGSLANTAVTVGGATATGTPTLGGVGTIGGATTISAAGAGVVGIHAPGVTGTNAGVGTQTFSRSLTYQAGSIFEWDLKTGAVGTAGTDFDSVAIDTANGSLSVDGTATTGSIFKVVLGEAFDGANAFWSDPAVRSWNVFAATNSATLGSDVFNNFLLFDTSSATVPVSFDSFGSFGFTNNGTTGTLTWTAVPEPTTALAGLLLTAGLLRRRRL